MFMFESQLMQMPGPRDMVIYRSDPRAFSVVQKPWGWAHISVQQLRGMVTGQIDACIIISFRVPEISKGCTIAPNVVHTYRRNVGKNGEISGLQVGRQMKSTITCKDKLYSLLEQSSDLAKSPAKNK